MKVYYLIFQYKECNQIATQSEPTQRRNFSLSSTDETNFYFYSGILWHNSC